MSVNSNLPHAIIKQVYRKGIQNNIEIYYKEQQKWIYDAFEKNTEITLNSLGVHFSLTDAYIDVEFEDTLEEF